MKMEVPPRKKIEHAPSGTGWRAKIAGIPRSHWKRLRRLQTSCPPSSPRDPDASRRWIFENEPRSPRAVWFGACLPFGD